MKTKANHEASVRNLFAARAAQAAKRRGVPDGHMRCGSCGEAKPLEDFSYLRRTSEAPPAPMRINLLGGAS